MKPWIAAVIAGGLAFLAGLLIGWFATGWLGPTVFALSAFGLALIPILGTVLQVYTGNQRNLGTARREKEEEHALKLVEGSLAPLCNLEFFGRDGGLDLARSNVLPFVVDYGTQGGKRYVQGPRFWKYAATHISKDPTFSVAWIGLEKLGNEWNDQKFELDRLTFDRLKALVQSTFGEGCTVAPDWIDPPPAKWYNPGRITEWIRRGILNPTFQIDEQVYPAAPGRTESKRFVLQGGTYTIFGAEDAGVLSTEKGNTVYAALLNDSELVEGLELLRSIESRIRAYLPSFSDAAWDFCQKVEASQNLPGTCEICRDFPLRNSGPCASIDL